MIALFYRSKPRVGTLHAVVMITQLCLVRFFSTINKVNNQIVALLSVLDNSSEAQLWRVENVSSNSIGVFARELVYVEQKNVDYLVKTTILKCSV